MTIRELIEALEKVENKDMEVIIDSDNAYDGIGTVDRMEFQNWTSVDGSNIVKMCLIAER